MDHITREHKIHAATYLEIEVNKVVRARNEWSLVIKACRWNILNRE
ncbi:hypothetical protein RvY_08578 [Ramazzottius varieornatus]|uniref:Uncharacterized protein n=1 Tax=Ramazzottius varieornatus TaxID=947166 RepID=A0A1D1V6D6_RAMVA|nr:hypothetical protein RvY_08578 [Ramazzottius varieornatus]